MITSKQIIKLSEDWATSVNNGSKRTDVFKNPGSTDYKELNSYSGKYIPIRFIADAKNKDIYVWDADHATHEQVSRSLGFYSQHKYFQEPSWIFDGYGTLYVVEGKIKGEFFHGTSREITDQIKETQGWLVGSRSPEGVQKYIVDAIEPIFRYNWSFINRYVSNFSTVIETLRKQYFELVNKYGYSKF